MRTESQSSIGRRGERIAGEVLTDHGLNIVTTHYRFARGEIDIIAMDGEVLVFCEVKTRSSDAFGEPEYAVTARKQSQIRKVAEAYLYEHELVDQVCRFDVVAVRLRREVAVIRYLRNAF